MVKEIEEASKKLGYVITFVVSMIFLFHWLTKRPTRLLDLTKCLLHPIDTTNSKDSSICLVGQAVSLYECQTKRSRVRFPGILNNSPEFGGVGRHEYGNR